MLNLIGTYIQTPLGTNLTRLTEVFESNVWVALSSGDVPELKSTQNIDKCSDFMVTAISTAVGRAIATSETVKAGALIVNLQSVSKESLA